MKPTLFSLFFTIIVNIISAQNTGFEYSFSQLGYIRNTLQVPNGLYFNTSTKLYFMNNKRHLSKIEEFEGTNFDISYQTSHYFAISDSSWILVLAGLYSDIPEGDDILIIEFSNHFSTTHHFKGHFDNEGYYYKSIAINELGNIEIISEIGDIVKKIIISNDYEFLKMEDYTQEEPKYTFDNGSTLLLSDTATLILDKDGIVLDTIDEATQPIFLCDSTLDFRSKTRFYTYGFQKNAIISTTKIPYKFKKIKNVQKNSQGYYFLAKNEITLLSKDNSEKSIYKEPCRSRFYNNFLMLDEKRIIILGYDNISGSLTERSIVIENPINIERPEIDAFDVQFVRYGGHSDDHGFYFDYRYNFKIANTSNIPIRGLTIRSNRQVDHGYTEQFLYHNIDYMIYPSDTLNFKGEFSIRLEALTTFNLKFSTNDHSILANCEYYKFKAKVRVATQFPDSTSLDIFPNPSDGNFIVNSKIDLKYSLIDMNGQSLKSGFINSNKNVLNLTNHENGIYFLKLLNKKNQLFYKKIIIQK